VKDDNTTHWPNGTVLYSEYGKGTGALNTLLKGEAMWASDNSLERRSLEMRINVER